MDSRFLVMALGVLFVGGCGTSTIVLGGSPGEGGGGAGDDAGASPAFPPNGPTPWSLSAKVTRDDVEPDDGLGAVVAATTDVVVASSAARDDSGAPSSAVYVFERRGIDRWRRTQRLLFGSAGIDALSVGGTQALIATSTVDPSLGTVTSSNVLVAEQAAGRWSVTGELPSLATAQHTSVLLGAGNARAMVVDATGAVTILSQNGGQWASEYSTQLVEGEGVRAAAAFTGDRALVTSEAYDTAETTLAWSGHILERGPGGWSEVAVIDPTGLAHDPDPPGFRTASLAGDWAVFSQGATKAYPGGAVHLYHRGADGSWAFAKDLDVGTTNGSPSCKVGCRVALDGQHLVLQQIVTGLLVFSLQNGDWVNVGGAADTATSQFPGVEMALGGDVLAVGNAQDSIAANGGGAVQMYAGLAQDHCYPENDVLTSNDELAQSGDILFPDRGHLGLAVDTNGTTAVVTDLGAAIVYDNVDGVWTEQAVLTAPDGPVADQGYALDLGRGVLAGSSVAIAGIQNVSGGAYVFDRGANGAFSTAIPLVPAGLPEWQMVGFMLSAADGLVAVGSIHASYSVPGNPDTFATVFERGSSGWRQTALLETPDNIDQCSATPTLAAAADHILLTGTCATVVDDFARAEDGSWQKQPSFGPASHELTSITATAIADDLAAVAGYDDTNDYAIYVFSRANGTWTETARIDDGDAVGPISALSLTADTLAAGYTGFYPNSARLYRLRGGVWSEDQSFAPQDAPTNPGFGNSVALGGTFLLVGSPGDGIAAAVAGGGAVYVFGIGPVAFR
jgi:FG-GAP repeat protein